MNELPYIRPVTREWLREHALRQMAYAAKRAAWTEVFFHGRPPEPLTETERKGRGGTIFDRRQYKLEI
jgi:hypothetical protein